MPVEVVRQSVAVSDYSSRVEEDHGWCCGNLKTSCHRRVCIASHWISNAEVLDARSGPFFTVLNIDAEQAHTLSAIAAGQTIEFRRLRFAD